LFEMRKLFANAPGGVAKARENFDRTLERQRWPVRTGSASRYPSFFVGR